MTCLNSCKDCEYNIALLDDYKEKLSIAKNAMQEAFIDFKRIQKTLTDVKPDVDLVSFYSAQSAVRLARTIEALDE